MQDKIDAINKKQVAYFQDLYQKHKGSPMAVSSESLEHKKLRYQQISGVFKNSTRFSIHDVGMGLADYYRYLGEFYSDREITYSGSDIFDEYVKESSARYPGVEFKLRNLAEKSDVDRYDYVVASGVFHQRQETRIGDWEYFAERLLENSFALCTRGMAFNMISPFVDFYQVPVYYANLPKWVNYINDRLSRFFEIRHDYALYEFTVFVYQENYIKSLHPQAEFAKYFHL